MILNHISSGGISVKECNDLDFEKEEFSNYTFEKFLYEIYFCFNN